MQEPPIPLFQTHAELQEAHEALIARFDTEVSATEAADPGDGVHRDDADRRSLIAIIDELRDFLRRGSAAGAYLFEPKERRAAQGLLDYWASLCYGANLDIARPQLAPHDPSLLPTLDDATCPYVGLEAFDEADARHFFGREERIAALLHRLREERLVVVTGTSGSGKSSLVLAGLLPALHADAIEGSAGWRYVPPLVPGATPLEHLVQAVAKVLPRNHDATGLAAWQAEQVQKIQADPGHLSVMLGADARTAVVVVDQFEEAMTMRTEENAPAFAAFVAALQSLVEAPAPAHRVLLTMRNDVDSRLAREYPELNRRYGAAAFPLSSMDSKQLREAIEAPAVLAGLKFQDGIVDDLIRSVVGEDAGLPLLQFNLMALWERRHGNLITLEEHRAVGSPRAAMATAAARLYAELPRDQQLAAQRIFLELSRQGDGVTVFRNRTTRRHLHQVSEPNIANQVILKFERARLLRVLRPDPAQPASDTIEVAHEALLRSWDLLQKLFAERRDERERLAFLRKQANKWREAEFDPAFLLGGLALKQAVEEFPRESMSALERDFIDKSESTERLEEARRAEEAERREQIQKDRSDLAQERAEAADRISKRLRLTALFAVSLLLTTTAVSWYGWNKAEVKGAQRLAQAQASAEMSLARAEVKAQERLEQAAETEKERAQVAAAQIEELILAAQDDRTKAGDELKALERKQTALRHDLARAKAERLLRDAELTATTDADKSIQYASEAVRLDAEMLTRVSSAVLEASRVRRADMRLSAYQVGRVDALALDPEGTRLLVANDDEVNEWQLGPGGQTKRLRGTELPRDVLKVNHVAYVSGGQLAAIAGDRQVWLWRAGADSALEPLEPHVGGNKLSISPDGQVLAAVSADRHQVLAWSLPDRQLILRYQQSQTDKRIDNIGFTAQGSELIAVQVPNSDLESRAFVFRRGAGGIDATPTVAVLPRCSLISAASATGGERFGLLLRPQLCQHDLRQPATAKPTPQTSVESTYVDDIIYSSDSRYVVKLMRRTNEAQVVDFIGGAKMRLQGAFDLPSAASYESLLSISGNGERLAIRGADGSIRLFGLGGGVNALADRGAEWVSPNEKVMVLRNGAAGFEARDPRTDKLLRRLEGAGGPANLRDFYLDADGHNLHARTECKAADDPAAKAECIVSQDLAAPAIPAHVETFASVQSRAEGLYLATRGNQELVYSAASREAVFKRDLPAKAKDKDDDPEREQRLRRADPKSDDIVIGGDRVFAVKRFAAGLVTVDLYAVEGRAATLARRIERPTSDGYTVKLLAQGRALLLSGPSRSELWDLRSPALSPSIVVEGRLNQEFVVNGDTGIVAHRSGREPWKVRDLHDGRVRGELPPWYRIEPKANYAWTDVNDEDESKAWQIRPLTDPKSKRLAGKGSVSTMQFSLDGDVVAITLQSQGLLRVYRLSSRKLLLDLDRSALGNPVLTGAGGYLRDSEGRLFPADSAKMLTEAQSELKRRQDVASRACGRQDNNGCESRANQRQ